MIRAEPIEYQAIRYRCPHCRKSWAAKASAVRHLARGCHKDPGSRTCATCANLSGPFSDIGFACEARDDVDVNDYLLRPKLCPSWQSVEMEAGTR